MTKPVRRIVRRIARIGRRSARRLSTRRLARGQPEHKAERDRDEAEQRRQNFGMVSRAFIRMVNAEGEKEVARYDLSPQGAHTAQVMAKLYRHNGEWKMHAIGENAR